MSNEIILRMDHVNKLYGPNKSEAARMMQNGSNKDEVYKQTGCTVALWDVTFDVPEGEIFVVIGLSGSGKSTAVRCFNKLTEPTDGGVYYRDQNVMEMPQKELLEYIFDYGFTMDQCAKAMNIPAPLIALKTEIMNERGSDLIVQEYDRNFMR